ncbi:MAG: cyclase/dehydrase [Verrucomicrobiales bacterium]|nr:cyclase/dehydrase [Verrucomicrobiales bacterium]
MDRLCWCSEPTVARGGVCRMVRAFPGWHKKDMIVREFRSELWLPLAPEKLFPFFADAANLDAITPSWLHFQIVTPRPIEMKAGALIDYRLCVHGLPSRWRTRSMSGSRHICSPMNRSAAPIGNGFTSTRSRRATAARSSATMFDTPCCSISWFIAGSCARTSNGFLRFAQKHCETDLDFQKLVHRSLATEFS